jgi:hypothetical protein
MTRCYAECRYTVRGARDSVKETFFFIIDTLVKQPYKPFRPSLIFANKAVYPSVAPFRVGF